MIVTRMEEKCMYDIERMYKRKAMKNDLQSILDFFERFIYLFGMSLYKVLTLFSIPMFFVGIAGGYQGYKLIMNCVKSNVVLWQSEFFNMTVRLLLIYFCYHMVKTWLEVRLSK